MASWLASITVASLLLGACGDGPDAPPVAYGIESFTVSRARVAQGESVTLAWRAVAREGDCRLRASRASSGADESEPVACTGGRTVVVDENVTYQFVALLPDRTFDERTVTILAEAVLETVDGTVVDPVGHPVGAATVAIEDRTTVTAADGTFTLDGVTAPYDIVVSQPGSDGDAWAHAFVGLDDVSPRLAVYGGRFGLEPSPSAVVQADIAVPADHVAAVCAEGVDGAVFGCRPDVVSSGTLSFSVSWIEGATTEVRLRAVIMRKNAGGVPIEYVDHATTAPLTLSDGSTVTAGDWTWSGAPATRSLNVSVTASARMELAYLSASARVSATSAVPLFDALAPATAPPFALPVPDLGSGRWTVIAQARSDDEAVAFAWRADVDGSADVSIDVPAPATPLRPSGDAPEVDTSTVFEVAGGSSLNTFLWFPQDDAPVMAVTTPATEARLPDARSYGVVLPAGTTYDWSVASAWPSTGDEPGTAWHADHPLAGGFFGGPGVSKDGAFAVSAPRSVVLR